ncbi:trypsin-like serine peptidase [Brevundimonas sp.]|uniref:trypsin-like serine peptidase n=1 Tax=Brevundimonas sp. TaxID=1871086 RepID=UPI003D0F55B8
MAIVALVADTALAFRPQDAVPPGIQVPTVTPTAPVGDPGPVSSRDRRVRADALPSSSTLREAARAAALVTTTNSIGHGDAVRRVSDIGTGVLISTCHVLTARHVLGDPRLDGETAEQRIDIRFHTLPISREATDPGEAITRTAVVAAWGRSGRLLDDWALLRLDRPVESITPLGLAEDACCGASGWIENALAGYPADRFDPTAPAVWVDPDCGRLTRLANGVLATRCQATSGNSGGPVLAFQDDAWRIVAILTRAPGPREMRTGQTYAIPIGARLRRAIADVDLGVCGETSPPVPY